MSDRHPFTELPAGPTKSGAKGGASAPPPSLGVSSLDLPAASPAQADAQPAFSEASKASLKPRPELLPPDALLCVAAVLTHGAAKHGDRGWEDGRPHGEDYGAMQRHLLAHWGGVNLDEGSGLPHLAHAVARGLILLSACLNGQGRDDRPNPPAAAAERTE